MLTLNTLLKAVQMSRSYGAPMRHQFGGPEMDNRPMRERIAREVFSTSTPVTKMRAHSARRRGRSRLPFSSSSSHAR